MTIKVGNAIFALAILPAFMTFSAVAGHGPGNAETDKLNMRALEQLFENNAHHLKNSMVNYIDTIDINQIPEVTTTDKAAKKFFQRVTREQLIQDIQKSPYVLGKDCHESPEFAARTEVGDLGGEVCFDLAQFYQTHKALSHSQRTLELVSLAYHEEAHHFQGKSSIELNEKEAYEVSSYVLNSVEFGHIAIAKWKAPKGPLYRTYFTGDRAKGLLSQLRSTNVKENNMVTAENIKCESATIHLLMPVGGVYDGSKGFVDYPVFFIGCSANPKIQPSALESLSSTEGWRGQVVIQVTGKETFTADKVSCYAYSDRCMLQSRDFKEDDWELVTEKNLEPRF